MIEAENLTKYYGDHLAIEALSFKVNKGEIVGLLGPNGAGKTTTMRILSGFMPPSRGTVKVAGYDSITQSLEMRKRVGYMPETVPLYNDMTVRAYLGFFATLKAIPKPKREERVAEIMRLLQIDDYSDTLIEKLSKGYRQRVGLAQAILHEPEVLILDEPTIGIDPRQVVETRNLIKKLGKEHTIILSSHILPELSMICEKVIIMDQGKIVAVDRPDTLSLKLRGAQHIELEVMGPAEDVLTRLNQVKGVWQVRMEGSGQKRRFTVECPPGEEMCYQLATAIVQGGWRLLELKSSEMSLEDIFLKLTSLPHEGLREG
ncbi:MAG: ABC transporter ATP-binding protein [Candidatus Tectomicrobia bacterium]|uniref:ABC transporter ATP-binding protein n=1 Tax=Tectimicrobiota bacterium TaxID=2528274 RepID=A0A933GLP6_UNCTE|nr:ABC transporter ATP-binding protein [Candidatus Tectomicrobia bacterium]